MRETFVLSPPLFLFILFSCIVGNQPLFLAVIALLHGISYGLALNLTCCADIRVCTRSTRFSLKEVDIGIAADLGALTRLPKVVGSMGWVKEVAYTCREFDGAEAQRVGFANTVCEDKVAAWEQCLEMARAVVAKSPVAIESTKELLDWGVGRPVVDGEYLFSLCISHPFPPFFSLGE